ncbi:MAG TPA: YceI family protein [Gemmatimonadales bacterium]|jgi:polyisoprenoid-binding protein YceI|nr:YceI family protein [Gemmatimonadales bacterium]
MQSLRMMVLLFAAWSPIATADLAAQRPIPSGSIKEGVLSFDGRATVGSFTGRTTTITGELTGGADLSAVKGWVEAPVTTLVTGNGKRDKDLNKSMESEKYPTIRYDLDAVVPGEVRGDIAAVTLDGYFQIHGVRQHVAIPATVTFLPDGVRVQGKIPISLKSYKIGGLTKMMGMLKMYDEILTHVDLTFGSGNLPSAHAEAGTARSSD